MSRHIPIAEMAEVLHAKANPWKGFAMIWGYFDDAGTHIDSEVTSIGGLVGTTDAWTEFEADWQAVIDDFKEYGLRAFHAYECEAGAGDFKRLNRTIREAISRRLSRIVAQHTDLRPFWSSVVLDAWDEIATPDMAFLERYEKPFGLSFEWILQQVSGWSKRYADGSPVSLMFSEQNDFKDRMQDIFDMYLEGKNFGPLRSLTFGSYREFLASPGGRPHRDGNQSLLAGFGTQRLPVPRTPRDR